MTNQATEVTMKFCNGIEWPVGATMERNFPYQLLADGLGGEMKVNSNQIHHSRCSESNYILENLDSKDSINKCCAELVYHKSFISICDRAKMTDVSKYSYKYLTYNQLENRLKETVAALNEAKLDNLNKNRRIKKLLDTLSMHERLVQLIAMNDIPRLKKLVNAVLKDERNIHYMKHIN